MTGNRFIFSGRGGCAQSTKTPEHAIQHMSAETGRDRAENNGDGVRKRNHGVQCKALTLMLNQFGWDCREVCQRQRNVMLDISNPRIC